MIRIFDGIERETWVALLSEVVQNLENRYFLIGRSVKLDFENMVRAKFGLGPTKIEVSRERRSCVILSVRLGLRLGFQEYNKRLARTQQFREMG